jgi:purine-binding chemotaxis protein CheW
VSLSTERQLIVEVGDSLFAAAAADVREVMEPLDATPVPGAVPEVLGLINLRGAVMLAAQLGTLLGLESRQSKESAFVVVERGEGRLALQVDRLVGVAHYSPSELDVDSEHLAALGARGVVMGVDRYGERPCFRLDIPRIFERLLDPATGHDATAESSSTRRQV